MLGRQSDNFTDISYMYCTSFRNLKYDFQSQIWFDFEKLNLHPQFQEYTVRQGCAYGKIKNKEKTWPKKQHHENLRRRQVTQVPVPAPLQSCQVTSAQSLCCLPWASIALSKKEKRKRKETNKRTKKKDFELSWSLVQLKNALIPWNTQYQNKPSNVDFEDAFSESLLDFLFYNVSKNEK